MQVSIKKFEVAMELKNKGVELEIRDTKGNHLGDLIVRKSGLEWCKGRRRAGNGVSSSWEEFMDWMKD